MTIQRTLLERIRDPEPEGHRSLHVSSAEVYDSILSNLQNLLNTCRGNCLVDDTYGLPHLSAVRSTMPKSLATYEAAIRTTIERHEPRLTSVRVRHYPEEDRGMELRFEITGVMQDEEGTRTVRFETVADTDGRTLVRR